MILIESGNRIHATDYDWPKNPTPSGKLRHDVGFVGPLQLYVYKKWN